MARARVWVDSLFSFVPLRWRRNTNRRTLFILGALFAFLFIPYVALVAPPHDFPEGGIIEIEEGASLGSIANQLEEGSVIRSSILFHLSVFVFGREREIEYGDYVFKRARNVFSIAKAFSYGDHGLEPIRVRIPEGATVREIAAIIDTELQRFNAARFIESALPLEGRLYPDTYFFLPTADDALVLRTLRDSFDARLGEMNALIVGFGKPLDDVIIMASILEREAHNQRDRRMIAGVLWKRIEIDMPLQVDAVFLYTLGRTTFELTSADLASNSPYNTYRNKGLPPTPIGNPSLDSLRAAVTPIESNYLYYLADENFVTYFSETYEEHLAKKRKYLGG